MIRLRPVYGLAALPLGAMLIASKWRDLQAGGFRLAARALGRPGEESLSLWDRLSFLRWEIFDSLLLLPAAAILIAAVLRPRWRPVAIWLLAGAVMVLVFIQIKAVASVGGFLHVRMILSALRFAHDRPDMLGSYVALGGLAKLGVVMVASAVLAWWAGRRDPDRIAAAAGGAPVASARTRGLVTASVLASAALPWLPRTPATPLHRSLLAQSLSGYWATGDDKPFEAATPAALHAEHRRLTRTTTSVPDSAYWGKVPDADIIAFVFETVPARCLDLAGPLDDLPNLRRLRQHALVGTQHYTSYPYSSLANFSLMTSWYPPGFSREYVDRHIGRRVPALLWHLRARGYRTALYEPFAARYENDPAMFRMVGVERHVSAGGRYERKPGMSTIAAADSTTLVTAHADIEGWLSANQRYAVILTPQVSHGPWEDPVPGRTGLSLLERCRALVAVQDRWIGDLLAIVARHGRLDRTIVAILGDHGVRTIQEDPAFLPGVVDDYSFHTPLMLHATAAFDSTIVLNRVTSMIDVAPSLLDLLGVERDRDLEQGLPLWDRQLERRVTWFFARQLFGADGLHDGGRFLSWNAVSGVTCAATGVMRCAGSDVLPAGPLADSIISRIGEMTSLQRAWVEAFVVDSAAAAPTRGP